MLDFLHHELLELLEELENGVTGAQRPDRCRACHKLQHKPDVFVVRVARMLVLFLGGGRLFGMKIAPLFASATVVFDQSRHVDNEVKVFCVRPGGAERHL
jgi:hypothetical protein